MDFNLQVSNTHQVIHSTFLPLTPASTPFPKQIVPDLLSRFSSAEGYTLFPDVPPFLQRVRRNRSLQTQGIPEVVLGIITNSDDRVLSILSSLGVSVAHPTAPHSIAPVWTSQNDKDFQSIALSYDVGFEKPDRKIFDSSKSFIQEKKGTEYQYVHIGDDLDKDVKGADAAGWKGVLLDRNDRCREEGISRVRSLADIGDRYFVSK